jgi:arylsulfatase A
MHRRTRLLPVFLAVSSLSLLSTTVTVHAAEPPNVLLIYTDDQGSIDMGCYGSDDLQTPHMDALARRGVRFTQMYAPAPICSPSRAGLLTGRHPLRAGLPTNVGARRGLVGMPQSEVTIADLLGGAGYRTGHVGKWHVGHTTETRPLAQGFDETYGHIGGCIDNYSHYFFWSGPNRHDLWRNGEEIWEDGKFFPNLMVRECERFLEENRARPFFLYWAINVPHYPYQGTAKWRAAYAHLATPRREYAAFLSTMDEIIGQVLGKLESLGLRERTLVILQSDHGHSTEVRAFRGGGNAGPYRGAKGCLFEGGVRVPAIVSWPGQLPENETRDQLVTACDWLPTIADLCGAKLPERRLDGASIAAVIRSATAPSPHRRFHWQFKDQWAVREGDWKLLGNPKDNSAKAPLTDADRLFLANLGRDVSEMTNYAKDHPDVVERLKRLHEEWATQFAASE